YEAFLGNAEGDAQPCLGDSGGPLFTRDGDDFVVHGVVSWGLAIRSLLADPVDGESSACQFGGVYATFGPAVRRMLALDLGLLEGDDPTEACAVAPELDHCDGDVALRCVRPNEGAPRVTEI